MKGMYGNIKGLVNGRLIIPTSFEECLTYAEQILFLAMTKQNLLKAGDNINMVQNDDGTVTINANTDAEFNIAIEATVDENTGVPYVTVTETVQPSGIILYTFNFHNLKGEQGEQGIQGIQGETGATPVVGATASVDSTTGTPNVTVTKTGTDAAPNFNFAFTGIKGERGEQGEQGIQGIQGIQGDQGETGVTPVISANATVDSTTGTPTVNVTKTGTDAAPVLTFAFTGLKGEQGIQGIQGEQGDKGDKGDKGDTGNQGPQGVTPSITASANVSGTSGTPSVTVVKSGTDAAPNFAFNFAGLKGEQGNVGATPSVTGAATVDNTSGTPSVSVTKSGTDAAPVLNFAFTGLKGAQGEQGIQGIQGIQGQTGATPVVGASATVDNTSGSPAVTVVKSGTDAAPSFAFNFTGIKGAQGEPGQNGQNGQDGVGVPSGGTTGQFLVKASNTDYDTEWVTVPAAVGNSF